MRDKLESGYYASLPIPERAERGLQARLTGSPADHCAAARSRSCPAAGGDAIAGMLRRAAGDAIMGDAIAGTVLLSAVLLWADAIAGLDAVGVACDVRCGCLTAGPCGRRVLPAAALVLRTNIFGAGFRSEISRKFRLSENFCPKNCDSEFSRIFANPKTNVSG